MKKQNSKFKVEVVKSNNDKPYVVIETETNTIISRHVSRDGAQNVMNFQTKTPTFEINQCRLSLKNLDKFLSL